jgi:spermidine synthase
MRQFIDLANIYKCDLDTGNYYIFKSNLTYEQYNSIPDTTPFKDKMIIGKEYVILYNINDSRVMMSNHETEIYTNQKFIDNAKGDVIIFGLGLGLIILPLLKDDNIKSIDVVEIDNGIIEVVSDVLKVEDIYNKLNIINGDMRNYHLINKKKYDTIYFDIWYNVDEKELNEIEELHSNWSHFLNEGGWMDSWLSEKRK